MTGPVRATVVVTGDEVLHGRVPERNAAHLCAWLEARGVLPERVTVLPDDRDAVAAQVRDDVARGATLVITSGGLGGTHDDITMSAVADAAGVGMALHEVALGLIRARLAAMEPPAGRTVDPAIRDAANRKQATLPDGARMLPPIGTAPGCVLTVGGAQVVVLPGPPFELQPMWAAAVRDDPGLAAMLGGGAGEGRRVLRVAGVVETQMIQALRDLGAESTRGVRLGICAKVGELELTLADDGRPGAAAALAEGLRAHFGAALYSDDGATLEAVIGRLLVARGHTLALAESCTGGMVGERLTAVDGASAWFLGGVVSYANAVKAGLLGVPEDVLVRNGAVSPECAAAMADGARASLGADWAVSVTGIAGPSGGTADKPVGLVYTGCAGPDGTTVERYRLHGDRDLVRRRATAMALHMLRRRLAA